MGTGKSSVSQLVAQQLRFNVIDTDEWIEHLAGKSISLIFSQDGEARFRQYERQFLLKLPSLNRTIISTGGGLAANHENLALLKKHALVVCLWASPGIIWERIRHQQHRPLLRCADPPGRIRELLAQRSPFYRQAHILISTELRSVKEVAHQIVHQYYLAQKQRFAGESSHPPARPRTGL
jgi:shikimate kinase